MGATLPGRTHGLGLITTRLLDDFPDLTATSYAGLNLVAALAGSLLCWLGGWTIDRYGAQRVGVVTLGLLALSVVWMSQAQNVAALAVALLLVRGLGQSQLSVVSLATIGKPFPHRPGPVMGGYAVAMTFLLAAWTGWLGYRVQQVGWRDAWWEMGLAIAILAPVFLWYARPVDSMLNADASSPDATTQHRLADSPSDDGSHLPDATLRDALATSTFWCFSLGISLFGMISAGFSLFQQSIFADRGLEESLYQSTLVFGLLVGLAANVFGGWLAARWSLAWMLAGSLVLLAVSLALFPHVDSPGQAYGFTALYSAAGGLITVLFFTVWGQTYGPRHLARIQGAAQWMTVLASSLGPLLFAWHKDYWGNYDGAFWALAAVCAALAAVVAMNGWGRLGFKQR